MAYSYRIGRIARAHGLRGEVSIQLFRPRALPEKRTQPKQPERLAVDELECALQSVQGTAPDRALIKLEGIDDRDAAERIEGAYLYADPASLPSLLTDELDRMVGAEVVDTSGNRIGPIRAIQDNGAQALLEIGEEEILIPAPFIVEVRPGEVVIDPPEGLLDVNRG